MAPPKGVNPFAKVLGPPGSSKSGFSGGAVVNPSITPGNNPPAAKGNMPIGGSMQSQMDAVKRRLAADVADDKKADKAEPAGTPKKKAIKGIAGSASDGGNATPNQMSNGIG